MSQPEAQADQDRFWMRRALDMAARADTAGEVPVGAIVVENGREIAQGWNRPIELSDPTAHAEVVAIRSAAASKSNYRLPGATLYVTLEPCAMCAGAIVQARIARVVFGAWDPRAGAVGTVFDVLGSPVLNHRPACLGGVLAAESSARIRAFFSARRASGGA